MLSMYLRVYTMLGMYLRVYTMAGIAGYPS